MGDKKVVELSRFFLFEEAADSEADFGAHDQWNYPLVLAGNQEEDDDDDDAESCICNGSLQESRGAQIDVSEEDQWVHETHSDCDDDDGGFNGIGHHHKMSAFEDEEEEKEGMISEVASTANSYSTRKCVQSSNKKSLSEMDKSRLFWEACLAS